MDLYTKGQWTDAIENLSVSMQKKEKKLKELSTLWKFVSASREFFTINGDFGLNYNNEEVSTVMADLNLIQSGYSDVLEQTLQETELNLLHNQKQGFYMLTLYKHINNFTTNGLLELQEELIMSSEGEMVHYCYVKEFNRTQALYHKINANLKVKEITREDVIEVLKKEEKKAAGTNKKWLILTLDNYQSKCDHFFIKDEVLYLPFESGYDRVFLFDFFKSEIIELKTHL